jgi:tetratricopeptide (TPR) repeat protein
MTTPKQGFCLLLTSFLILFCGGSSFAGDKDPRTSSGKLRDTAVALQLLRTSASLFNTNSDSAMDYARKAYALSNKINFEKGEWQSLNLIGNILKSTGNYPEALEVHLRVLQLLEKIGNPKYLAASYNNIGEVYKGQGDFKNAVVYYTRAKDMLEKSDNRDYLINAYLNLGDNYDAMNLIDSAIAYQNKAYVLAIQQNDLENIGPILGNLGNVHFKLKQYELSRGFYKSSIPYAHETKDQQTLMNSYLGITRIYNLEKNDSAIYYGKLALLCARDISSYQGINDCSEMLFKLYEQEGMSDSALLYLKLATA